MDLRQKLSGSKRLVSALAITGSWFLIELAGGLYSNSLALVADAAHMLTDLAALGLSLFALKISARPATQEKTYGWLRAEILAALANGVFLILIALYILYESYRRLLAPQPVKSAAMLVIASAGLAANLLTMRFLYHGRNDSLNLRGAFLHVLGDTMGSAGAVLAGVLMMTRQWYLADPAVSAMVAGLILYGAWKLVTESVDVLLEAAPRDLKVPLLLTDLGAVPGVLSVHDLHVWTISSGTTALSCHVVLKKGADAGAALEEMSRLLKERYRIEHTTIQMEPETWNGHSSPLNVER